MRGDFESGGMEVEIDLEVCLSGKALCRVLENHGWQLRRASGSHHVDAKPGDTLTMAVPVQRGDDRTHPGNGRIDS
jgi:predicted RNA binding protein YcfA (HicA-like mRNA interferase family)